MRHAVRAACLLITVALGIACGGKTEGDPSSDAGSGCTPGATKKLDCNSCTCDSSGQWSCTKMACLDASPDGGCMPGTIKKLDECNSCSCMANGEWACTGIACIDSGIDARDPRCPSSWSAAQTGSHDDLCPETVCNYAEGSCSCPDYCGGAPPGPDWKPTWTCTPKPPPRTDGCPDVEPTAGAACSTAGKSCTYDRCCMYRYDCVSGNWQASAPICPP